MTTIPGFVRWTIFVVAAALAVPPSARAQGAPVYSWSRAWGRATFGSEDGPVTSARFRQPSGVVCDAAGQVYVADTGNHTIRRISADGVVTTLAGAPGEVGSADGTGAAARFNFPKGLALAPDGSLIVADHGNHLIRRIAPDGTVTTVAGVAGEAENRDGPLASARLYFPEHVTVDRVGAIYVHAGVRGIRRVHEGRIETWIAASDVNRLGEQVGGPYRTGPLVMGDEDDLYFLGWDQVNGRPSAVLRRRDSAGNISTLALGWSSNGATYPVPPAPRHLAKGPGGIYVMTLMESEQSGRYWVFRLTSLNSAAMVGRSWIDATGMAVAPTGQVLLSSFADEARGSIDAIARLSDPGSTQGFGNSVQPWAGEVHYFEGRNGDRTQVRFGQVTSLATDAAGNLWVADVRGSHRIRAQFYPYLLKLTPSGTSAVASVHTGSSTLQFTNATAVAVGPDGTAYFSSELSSGGAWRLTAISPAGVERTVASRPYPEMRSVNHMAVDSAGNVILSHEGRLRKLSPSGEWSILAGVKTVSTVEGPAEGEREIRDGVGSAARFGGIRGLSADAAGNVYVLDVLETRAFIRRVSPTGEVTTITPDLHVVSGTESFLPLSGPARDAAGNFHLVYSGGTIRRVNPQGGIEVIGGRSSPRWEIRDGTGTAALFSSPESIAVDGEGRVYVVDGADLEIRVGTPQASAPTITTQPESATVTSGAAVSFRVVASGSPTPTFQWYFNGAAIAGATGATYTINSAQPAQAGDYLVVVSNSQGTATSQAARLTVTTPAPPPAPPSPGGGGGSGGGGGGGANGPLLTIAFVVSWFLRRRLAGPAS